VTTGGSPPGFCRDCLTAAGAGAVCAACGGPRLLRHAELNDLAIAHVDCDAFYAAIEKRDNPALRDQPLIIGGGRRGVVSTACYLARLHGVKSAMPMFKALALCPQAVVLPPDMEKYKGVSRRMRALMDALTPLVEPLSIDEAFLDLTGTGRLHGAPPALVLARFARRVEAELGITVSVGLSYNKFLAKLASDMDKPRGFSVIGRAEAAAVLAPLPVGRIWGVGPATQARLGRLGFKTIADLQRAPLDRLVRAVGEDGARLWRLARGEDVRRVTPDSRRKSLSSETTLASDIADPDQLARHLRAAADVVGRQLRAEGLHGVTATLKLKTSDFRLVTRSRKLERPTQTAADILEATLPLLAAEADGRRFRLIGVGVAIGEAEAPAGLDLPGLDLDAGTGERRLKLEQAMDRVRTRFGQASLGQAGLGQAGLGLKARAGRAVSAENDVGEPETGRRRD
jgi:DNA polymerase-4